jgi:hypothetical protein
MKKFTQKQAKELAKKYNINLDVIPLDEWHYGLNVELEHGSKLSKLTNITNDDKDMTLKITLCHLLENHQYYKYLKKMEEKLDKYWSTRKKPNIFLE